MIRRFDEYVIKKYYKLKIQKDRILLKLLAPIANLNIPADLVSLLGLIFGIASAIFLQYSNTLFIIFWIGKRMADLIDGPIVKINKVRVFRGINMDNFCDISFSLILFTATVPLVGLSLPFLAVLGHVVHVFFHFDKMGKSLFAPNNFAQFFFLFGLIKAGLIFQIIYTLIALIYMRTLRKIRS